MRRVIAGLLLICLLAPQGRAGPWPREAGAAFTSAWVGQERVSGRNGLFSGGYAEYGLARRLTLSAATETRRAAAEVFRWEVGARWFLGEVAPGAPLSFGIGAQRGTALAGPQPATRLRLVAHLGHGLNAPWRGGWLRTSLSALPAVSDGSGVDYETFSQVGLRPAERALMMLSVSTYHTGESTFLKLSPALGYEAGRLGTIVIEGTQEIGHDRDRRLTLSFWRSF
jgi:hypothetical protein